MYVASLVIWAVFLGAAIFYVRSARHRQTRPLAAYLIFVITFTVCASVLFAVLSTLLQVTGQAALLSHPLGGTLFLGVVLIPSFLVARWQLRKPPYRPRQP